MPTGISAADKKILLAGGALLLLMATALAILTPPNEQFESPVPSSYSTQSHGAAAAYRLLQALRYPVRRWENPPTELKKEPGSILLVMAEPLQAPTENERKALSDFVTRGGHVLFTGGRLADYFADGAISQMPPDPKFVTYGAVMPSGVIKGAKHVTLQPQAAWAKLQAEQMTLYGADDAAGVVSWEKGAGEILWWAGSTPLTNSGITRDDNLQFFLNSVANWKEKGGYHIYWDEYFHGQRSSLWSYVGKTSLAWSALQLGLLVLAVLFTFARRSGPTFVPAEGSRLWPLEFVDTLGGLYERAKAASSAVAISYARFKTMLARQLALPTSTRDSELVTEAEQRLGWKESGLGLLLGRAAAAQNEERYPAGEALKIVQELEKFTEHLDARSQIQKGKK
jgi:Domain of unknown function (DUF4350)